MKYLVFSLFFGLYTEGVLLAQAPTILKEDTGIDSTDFVNQIKDNTAADSRPRISPYAAAEEKYNKETIERRDIDAEKWHKATAGIDYSADKETKQVRRQKSSNGGGALAGAFLLFLKWFFIIGGILLVAFLIFRFIGEGNIFSGRNRKIGQTSEEIDLNTIEENLETAELDPIIKKAIAARNFSLAIRLYYLSILKELTLAGAITWKKDKTNRIYVQEMTPHPLLASFRHLTVIFERVWYGDTPLDETRFDSVQLLFQNLLNETRKR